MRRSGLAAVILCVSLFLSPALGAEWRHALSLQSAPHYAEGFQHFDYVNPDAPKGGAVRIGTLGTFDNFNLVISGVKGTLAAGLDQIYDQLMVASLDEVSTEYGQLAEAVQIGENSSSVSYRLRREARWHDGRPVTAEDVVFSFTMLRQHSPFYGSYFRHVTQALAVNEREIRFEFDQAGNRELPQIIGQLRILPKHWWQGRDITQTTLEPPLGSGPYRIKSFSPGHSIVYERVEDYWGKDLGVSKGQNNFALLTYEYFRDATAALEAFKKGDLDWRVENVARNWATAYDFPAVRDKKVLLEEFPIRSTGVMQAFVLNLRRGLFQDARVRRALTLVFDFEDMNRTLFFGQYERVTSFFHGTELASSGLPHGRELALLEEVRTQIPQEVFTTPYQLPVNGSVEQVRQNMREAFALLEQAGWTVERQGQGRPVLKNAKGEAFKVEILLDQPVFERVALAFKPALERLGLEVAVRVVDDAQYQNRLRSFDYDIIITSWGQSLSPGNEQTDYWSSRSAQVAGSRNLAGIANPAVDHLVNKVIFASDRAEQVAATHALDRVLLWNHYVIPQWTYSKQRTARWDKYQHPAQLPLYGASGFPDVWWAKAP